MNNKEVKAEFGQIILESYPLDEIIVQGQLAESLSMVYRYHNSYAHALMESVDLDHFKEVFPEEYTDFISMISGFAYWWNDLE